MRKTKVAFNVKQFIDIWRYAMFSIVFSSACLAYDIHDVADPPVTSVIYVGEVVQNGMPLQMKQFSTESSVTEVLAFYKQRWSDISRHQKNVPAYLEKHVGEWHVLSKMETDKSVVVQVRKSNRGSTEGYISVSDISRATKPNRWSSEFPRIQGTQLLSNTESIDKGRVAYTLVLFNDYSVHVNRDYYRDNMHADGWQYARGSEKTKTAILYFRRDKWHCDISVTEADDGKTIIIANLVEMNENS